MNALPNLGGIGVFLSQMSLSLEIGIIFISSFIVAALALFAIRAIIRQICNRSQVRGEIALLQKVTLENHPEFCQRTTVTDSEILLVVKEGVAYDVGLHIEHMGKPIRLRDWTFTMRTTNGLNATCLLKADAWPPPTSWQSQFPDTIRVTKAEATFLLPHHVYAIYCQVRIKSYIDNNQRSMLNVDSFEATATDSTGRKARFQRRIAI